MPSGEEMVWQSPVDMCTLAMGADVAEKKLATVVHVETSARMDHVHSSGVRGRMTLYKERIGDCTRSKLKSRGESVGAPLIGRRGRPQKTAESRIRVCNVDILVLNLQLPGKCHELHLDRADEKESVSSYWVVRPQAHN